MFFAASNVEKTCHKVSVIHVTQPKLCPIQIVVSDFVEQAVTNVPLNMSFYVKQAYTSINIDNCVK